MKVAEKENAKFAKSAETAQSKGAAKDAKAIATTSRKLAQEAAKAAAKASANAPPEKRTETCAVAPPETNLTTSVRAVTWEKKKKSPSAKSHPPKIAHQIKEPPVSIQTKPIEHMDVAREDMPDYDSSCPRNVT